MGSVLLAALLGARIAANRNSNSAEGRGSYLPDNLGPALLHTTICATDATGAAPQRFRLNGTAAPHHVFTSGATAGGDQHMCWDCSGCQKGDRLFSVVGCQPSNGNQQWVVTPVAGDSVAGGGDEWVMIGVFSGEPMPSLCVTAHDDGRAELLLEQCNSSDIGQHWQTPSNATAGATMTSRRFPGRCVDASPVDFSGVNGGFMLWPRPQLVEVSTTATSLCVSPYLVFTGVPTSSAGILRRAVARYSKILPNATTGANAATYAGCLSALALRCTGPAISCNDDAKLGEDMDESYELIIGIPNSGSTATATLEATSVWGLLRGLETFSQIVEQNHSAVETTLLVRAAPVRVSDRPRWSYRGLLIDTARHFMPLSLLRQHLDAMSYSKLNVLHWHHHDAGVWSLESTSIRDLSRAAAAPGWQYSHAEVRALVAYARDRGIRVIPEFESPGHANALYKVRPGMSAVCFADYLQTMPIQGEMNPCKALTRDTMTGLLREYTAVFSDERVHLGGDEVSYACWGQDKSVQPGCSFENNSDATRRGAGRRAMPIRNETTYNQLEARFEKLLHTELAAHQKLPMHWHDPITERGIEFPRSTMVEVWDGTNRSVLSAVLSMGYPVVYAGSYYLDHLQLNWEDDLYSVDPGTFDEVRALPAAQQALLQGVEACMWSETVDRTNALQRVWPRAAATAERGWSSSNTTMRFGGINGGYAPGPAAERAMTPTLSAGHQVPALVLQRMHAHRCRLLARVRKRVLIHFMRK